MHNAGITSVSRKLPASFRYKALGGNYLITNEFGDWHWLDPGTFRAFVEGDLSKDEASYGDLAERNFIREQVHSEALISRMQNWKSFLRGGPIVHALALSTPTEEGTVNRLSTETGERILDTAFMSTSEILHFRFSSHGPNEDLELLAHLVSYAQRKNTLARKAIGFEVSGPVKGLAAETIAWIVKNRISWSTEILCEGPELPIPQEVVDGISAFHSALQKEGESLSKLGVRVRLLASSEGIGALPSRIGALLELGCRCFWIRPVLAHDRARSGVEHAALKNEFFPIMNEILDTLLGFGDGARELYSSTLLGRILLHDEAPVTTLRNPSMDGIGEMAYDTGGRVYTSDAGRILGESGDEAFLIGSVHQSGYHDLVTHPTIRSVVMATTLGGQPGWASNPYLAFCGSDPVINYVEQGSIHGRMVDSSHARWQEGLLDLLFLRLREEEEPASSPLATWAQQAFEE